MTLAIKWWPSLPWYLCAVEQERWNGNNRYWTEVGIIGFVEHPNSEASSALVNREKACHRARAPQ